MTEVPRLLAQCVDAHTAAAVWKGLEAERPMGQSLLTALACRNFPSPNFDVFVQWLDAAASDATCPTVLDGDAEQLIAILTSGILSIATFRTQGADGSAGGQPQPGARLDLGLMLTNLLKAPAAAKLVVQGPHFFPPDGANGAELQTTCLLGAYLGSLNPFGFGATHQTTMLRLISTLGKAAVAVAEGISPANDVENDDASAGAGSPAEALREAEAQLQNQINSASEGFKSVIERILRAGTLQRTATLQWLSSALHFAEAHRKSMQEHDKEIHFATSVILCHACVSLALPVVSPPKPGAAAGWFPSQVPTKYFVDDRSRAFCRYGDDEERVITGDRAVPPPKESVATSAASNPATEAYPPKMHLLSLGIRALTCFYAPCHQQWTKMAQQLQYPGLEKRQKLAVASLHSFYLAMLSDSEMAARYLAIADGAAQWLLAVLRVNPDGSVPRPTKSTAAAAGDDGTTVVAADPPPVSFAAWANLPLTIVDDVFHVAHALRGYDRRHAPLSMSFFQVRHMALLMLVVMGDTELFPKPHTHAYFPPFLGLLTEPRLPYFREFQNEPLFNVHVMRACVECYVAVQPCDHDRQNARFYLAHSLRELLRDASLANAVRPKYSDPTDVTLESLSSMVTAEATEALDHVFESLQAMRDFELANNRQPLEATHDKYTEYMQKGGTVQHEMQRATAALGVFDALVTHFKEGMTKHLVVQQISAALVAFVIRLAGPSAFELKIADPKRYGFDPRRLLGLVVQTFVRFRGNQNFLRFAVESQTSLQNFDKAAAFISERRLVPGEDLDAFHTMHREMAQTQVKLAAAAKYSDDAPEWARCALMYDLLAEPVALPTDGEELTFVEREAIRHSLLSAPMNPFTKQPLTMQEIDQFNQKPEVQQQVSGLRDRIAAWMKEMIANSGEEASAG